MNKKLIILGKNILRPIRDAAISIYTNYVLYQLVNKRGAQSIDSFNFGQFKQRIIKFIDSMRYGPQLYLYRYSISCTQPTLYASTYACMTLSLLGDLDKLVHNQKQEWCNYFNSFQRESDGLFYDPVVQNTLYDNTDWWGARHLALHLVIAYTNLGMRPTHPFAFLQEYYEPGSITNWLSKYDWSSPVIADSDIDNKIMNIGCLLQYQRDTWKDKGALTAIDELKSFLRSKINPATGMWGGSNIADSQSRSRLVQFAYHLFAIFIYDNEYNFDADRIVSIVLTTQNKHGGFGFKYNSSACEDIDSIDLLICFYDKCDKALRPDINKAINKAQNWILLNQVDDGGFVFRLLEKFRYGHDETSSPDNVGAMFPTWFRSVALCHILGFNKVSNGFKEKIPGYYFFD